MIVLSVTSSVRLEAGRPCVHEFEKEAGQALVRQIIDGNVHGDAEEQAPIAPRGALSHRRPQHPAREVHDVARLLDRIYELRGRQKSKLGVLPPDESFGAADSPRPQIKLRLDVQANSIALERQRKLVNQPDLSALAFCLTDAIHARRPMGKQRLAVGAACVPAEFHRVYAVLGIGRDPAADLQRVLAAFDSFAGPQKVRSTLEPLDGFEGVAMRKSYDKPVVAEVPQNIAFLEAAA